MDALTAAAKKQFRSACKSSSQHCPEDAVGERAKIAKQGYFHESARKGNLAKVHWLSITAGVYKDPNAHQQVHEKCASAQSPTILAEDPVFAQKQEPLDDETKAEFAQAMQSCACAESTGCTCK